MNGALQVTANGEQKVVTIEATLVAGGHVKISSLKRHGGDILFAAQGKESSIRSVNGAITVCVQT